LSTKIRHIDFYPDEYIAGVGAKMSAEQQGVYWMICSLISSHGGEVENDAKRIGRLVCLGPSKARRIINELILMGKITENQTKLSQKRTGNELEKAQKRVETAVEHGKKGGRPPKENNNLEKGLGSFSEKLTTNHQPPTIKDRKEDTNVSSQKAVAPYSPEFEEWWGVYPKKSDKRNAFKTYKEILKRGEITHDDLIKKTESYTRYCQSTDTFLKGAWRWLKDRRFEDEYEVKQGGSKW